MSEIDWGWLFTLAWIGAIYAWWTRNVAGFSTVEFCPKSGSKKTNRKFRRYPPWYAKRILEIKAWTPSLGCRLIAEAFNRKFGAKGDTVSKTYVAEVLKRSQEELRNLRARLRKAKPKLVVRNHEWGMDMTTVTGADGIQRRLLGIIDHGTRCCVRLVELRSKASWMILLHLMLAFRKYGAPGILRVDNEASFNSRWLKRFLFKWFGTEINTMPPHSPWKNGRIERFFKSFKQDFAHVPAGNLTLLIAQWRWYYNHARPHSGVDYRTPAEAWADRGRSRNIYQPTSLWDGALRMHYFPS